MSCAARRDEIVSYTVACLSMYLQALARGVELRDVRAYLCEDGRTVMLDAEDMEILASFSLAEKTTEAAFDERIYVEGFNKGNADDGFERKQEASGWSSRTRPRKPLRRK